MDSIQVIISNDSDFVKTDVSVLSSSEAKILNLSHEDICKMQQELNPLSFKAFRFKSSLRSNAHRHCISILKYGPGIDHEIKIINPVSYFTASDEAGLDLYIPITGKPFSIKDNMLVSIEPKSIIEITLYINKD
jgi:hypothetical protein